MEFLSLSVWVSLNSSGNMVARVRQPMAMGFCYGANLLAGYEISNPERACELVLQKLTGTTRKLEIVFEAKIDTRSRYFDYYAPFGRAKRETKKATQNPIIV